MSRVSEIRDEMLAFMNDYELIVCPVAAGPPTESSGRWSIDGIELRGSQGFAYSYAWTMLGFPAISVPFKDAAVQVIARPGHDEQAVKAAHGSMWAMTAWPTYHCRPEFRLLNPPTGEPTWEGPRFGPSRLVRLDRVQPPTPAVSLSTSGAPRSRSGTRGRV